MPVMDVESRLAVTIARAEGREEAVRIATQAVCSHCAEGDAPECSPGGAWWHPHGSGAYRCNAGPIWEAIKEEGWS